MPLGGAGCALGEAKAPGLLIHVRAADSSSTGKTLVSPGMQRPEQLDRVADPVGVGHDRDPLERAEVTQAHLRVREHGARVIALEPLAQLKVQAGPVPRGRRPLDGRHEDGSVVVGRDPSRTTDRDDALRHPNDGLEHPRLLTVPERPAPGRRARLLTESAPRPVEPANRSVAGGTHVLQRRFPLTPRISCTRGRVSPLFPDALFGRQRPRLTPVVAGRGLYPRAA